MSSWGPKPTQRKKSAVEETASQRQHQAAPPQQQGGWGPGAGDSLIPKVILGLFVANLIYQTVFPPAGKEAVEKTANGGHKHHEAASSESSNQDMENSSLNVQSLDIRAEGRNHLEEKQQNTAQVNLGKDELHMLVKYCTGWSYKGSLMQIK